MTDVLSAAPARSARAHQMATRAAFLAAGVSLAAWAPLVPFAKHRLGLSEGQLGLVLLCLGAGSVAGMPLAGAMVGRYGCRGVIVTSAVLAAVVLPMLAVAGHVWSLAVALLCFGAGIGTLDVSMNIHAVLVEREAGRAMMSGFHGLFSVGGIIGAGGVSLLMSAGAGPAASVLAVTVAVLLLVGVSFTSLLPVSGGDPDAPLFVRPHGRVLLLGAFCFVLFLAEGSVLDWSAVFLSTARRVPAAHAGFGYVAFATAMTVCRLTGDVIVRHLGAARVVLLGGLSAAGGFLLAVSVPWPAADVAAFALVGVGASNAVPVMFSAAGRQIAMPANLAIAAVTLFGYAGLLAGPPVVGLFAKLFGLDVGLAVVAVMLVTVAVTSTRVRL